MYNRLSAATAPVTEGSTIVSVTNAFVKIWKDYSVAFRLEVENYSDEYLHVHEHKIERGNADDYKAPVSIKPGTKEAMAGRKVGDSATGCVGTVSWIIGDTGKMMVIMYSAPYSFDFYSNLLAVGIFDRGSTNRFYKKWYKVPEHGFKRKAFYYDVSPLFFGAEGLPFVIKGVMGASHRPEIVVQFYPTTVERLAKTLKEEGILKTQNIRNHIYDE